MRCAVVLLLLAIVAVGRCWWPFSSESSEKEEEGLEVVAVASAVPFEMSSAEQKFLMEAQQLLELPPLEACQYQVIGRLRRSCGEIGEEELGKLSVALLTCQAQAEGRENYPCTEHMTLAECTSPMDASMWNAYHIISNRARSVCYAVRQQQFRHQTEVAVNTLSRSTREQLQAMEEISLSQHQIQEAASEALSTMHRQQDILVEQQQRLLTTHESMGQRLAQNLDKLTQEKTLIHWGQQQLANMTQSVQLQLEEASQVLEAQEVSRRESQDQILTDINEVQSNIREVWHRIDNSTGKLLEVLEDMGEQYRLTLENLRLINASVSSMLSLVLGMNSAVNSQLDWLIGQLGGTQDGLRMLTACAMHACYLLVATLCVLFVKAPAFARVSLLVLVVGNVVGEVKFHTSLSLLSLSALEIIILLGNWLFVCCYGKQNRGSAAPLQFVPPPPLTGEFPDEDSDLEVTLAEVDDISADTTVHEKFSTSTLREVSPAKPLQAPATPLRTFSFPRLAHSTPRSARQCSALTRSGLQCRLTATPRSSLCHRHTGL